MQKSRLLVHVGLAKTATTTLQKGLFAGLHQAGLIHYIGKHAQAGTNRQTRDVRDNRQNLLDHLVEPESDRRLMAGLIRPDLLNVYSDEFLTAPAFLTEKRINRLADPLDYPARLAGFLDSALLDVHILLILRSQMTRLPSQYAESYSLYAGDPRHSNWPDHLIFRLQNRPLFSCDDYAALMTAFQSIFGKDHVHTLFFEDLQQQRQDFVSGLAGIMNLDSETIELHLGNNHFNKRTQLNGHIPGVRYRSSRVHQVVRFIYQRTNSRFPGLLRQLERLPAWERLKAWHRAQGKIPHGVYPIPPLKTSETQLLKSAFQQSNKNLLIDHALNKDKLIRYGYLADPEQTP